MRIARILIGCAVPILAAVLAAVLAPRLTPLPRWIAEEPAGSIVLRDRTGAFLAEGSLAGDRAASPPGRALSLDRIDPILVHATLAAEDRRFFRHPGIDPLALARAIRESLARGEPLRGASTLTMQVVRMSRGKPRGTIDRLREVWWSLVLESRMEKDRILETYLNRAPYGANTRGIAAGAQKWLGKSPAVLSPAEAALLASIPRAPSRLDPSRHPAASKSARNMVLRRMQRSGWLTASETERACASTLDTVPTSHRASPHFNAWVLDSLDPGCPPPASLTTTLDPATQHRSEQALRDRLEALGDRARGGAVIVLDTEDAAVRAMVGSRSFDSPDAGQVNASLSPRQPGSAVKPFTYAVAFAESIRPSTILADVPTSYEDPTGVFAPRNYAGGFAGPVPARLALANSWNIPTVEVLERTGLAKVARGYEAVGLVREGEIERLGLGLTLGAGEVSLLDLAAAYATLARGGVWAPPHGILAAQDEKGRQIALPGRISRAALDAIACAWVNAILSDPALRSAAFDRGGPLEMDGAVAGKTGTSSDWRDAWAVLYSTRHTVAVWMGNPDGSPTGQVTGAEGPARVARTIMDWLSAREPALPFRIPEGIEQRAVCPLSGCAASAACPQFDWAPFRCDDPPLEPCPVHVHRRIDVATGLLARSCTPPGRVRSVLFVQLPERFTRWQSDRGFPRPPETATDCVCGLADCALLDAPAAISAMPAAGLAILRPVDGTVIACDPTLAPGQQMLALEAEAPRGAVVEWSVDGIVQGETRGGERLFWSVKAGDHRVLARLSRKGGGPSSGRSAEAVSNLRVIDDDQSGADVETAAGSGLLPAAP